MSTVTPENYMEKLGAAYRGVVDVWEGAREDAIDARAYITTHGMAIVGGLKNSVAIQMALDARIEYCQERIIATIREMEEV